MHKNYWLLVVSLIFYAWGEPKFVFIMSGSIAFNYGAAILVEKYRSESRRKKAVLIISFVFNLGLLFIFKYLNFTTEIFHGLFSKFRDQDSFADRYFIFTFQAMSYVIDVYRGIPAQHNICFLGLYISFFPSLSRDR